MHHVNCEKQVFLFLDNVKIAAFFINMENTKIIYIVIVTRAVHQIFLILLLGTHQLPLS